MQFKSYFYSIWYRVIDGEKTFEDKTLLKDFKRVKNPLFHWCADPFPLEMNGKKYIFAEIMTYLTGKGAIAYICLDDEKQRWKKCFKPKFHVSFPNIFKDSDSIYAIPETYSDGCVAKYSVSEGDFSWKKIDSILLSPYFVDTCFDKDNRSIMLMYGNEARYSLKDNLLYVRDYNEPTKVHFTVKDKMNVLRPAGNCFVQNGQLIFPSQDSRQGYGNGIFFNVIDMEKQTITPSGVSIHPNDIIKYLPLKKVDGCHTYNCSGNIEVIDIARLKFSFLGLLVKIRMKLSGK